MANVLNEEKKQQVLALGRLGWSLRRIQQATRIRRETASAYLKAAGIGVRPPSGWGRRAAKPANEVITDSGTAKPAVPVIPDPSNPNPGNLSTKGKAKATSKPANENEVITGFGVESSGSERKAPSAFRPPVSANRTGKPMVRDPETRKYRRTPQFVMTLGCSRKSVRLLAFLSSA
jgi:hypothetical protein